MELRSKALIGAIAGDIIGSPYEGQPAYLLELPVNVNHPRQRFTDDTVLTVAVADALLTDRDFQGKILEYARRYPHRGYGGNFKRWIYSENPQPYNSYGNGAAMRVSPVAWAGRTLDEVLDLAKTSAEVTHNHPEGIKAAQAVASAIFLARTGHDKNEIRRFITDNFDYKLDFTIESIRPFYCGKAVSQVSVPPSIVAFLDSEDFLSAIINAIVIGGDTDTQAAIAGSIASAFYDDIPVDIVKRAESLLPGEMIEVINAFEQRFVFNA